MKIQSICFRKDDLFGRGDLITIVFADGKKDILKKCPFSGCGYYHSTELTVCPIMEGSFADEANRQEEARKKRVTAGEARAQYEKRHMPEWRKGLPDMLMGLILFIIAGVLLSYLFLPKSKANIVSAVGRVSACLLFVCVVLEEWHQKKIKKRVEAIYNSVVLNGEEEKEKA